MNKTDYIKARERLESERVRLEENLGNVRQKLAALDLVWTQIFGGDAASPENTTHIHPSARELIAVIPRDDPAGSSFFISRVVDTVTSQIRGPFGVREVIATILENWPHFDGKLNPSTISGRLSKLAEDGRIAIVEPGAGNRPATYRRVG